MSGVVNKATAGRWVALAYVVALGVAWMVGSVVTPAHPLVVVLAADVAATFVVFGFGQVFRNSSFYDPYWSVGPIAIVGYYLMVASPQVPTGRQLLVAGLVVAWGIRLTYNWARQWDGLTHEDWRYREFRAKTGRAYPLVDLFGIHLFPTAMVYLGCLPLYPALVTSDVPLGLLDAVAAVVTAVAIWIEARADRELWAFRRTKRPGQILDHGLWGYSRHPNYFGEMAFWWGIVLFGWAAQPQWWLWCGAASITLMFVGFSIPALEKRSHTRRPGYAEYARRVALVVPWFPRRAS